MGLPAMGVLAVPKVEAPGHPRLSHEKRGNE